MTDAVSIAVARLCTEEGFRAQKYADTDGHTTIGYGFNVEAGISKRAAAALLLEQVEELNDQLSKFAWYDCESPRQSVFLDIAFNDGLHGLLAFPNMIAAAERKDWEVASHECHVADDRLDESRYAALRQILLTGA